MYQIGNHTKCCALNRKVNFTIVTFLQLLWFDLPNNNLIITSNIWSR